MEKANNDMMMDENSRSWYVLYTAPRLERKLMQHLTVAGSLVSGKKLRVIKKASFDDTLITWPNQLLCPLKETV